MEKIEKVIDMVDNPGRYTDEEFKAMLNDPESRKIYKTIVETRAAADMDDADLDIDKEWSNFAARHLDTAPRHTFIFGSKWNFMKIAAVFAVVLALSGASYAAYRYVKTRREENIHKHIARENASGNCLILQRESSVQERRS